MKVQVLKEVEAGNASEHSLSEAENYYFATLNGLDFEHEGHVVEVSRDPNTPIENPVYYCVGQAFEINEINSFNIQTLRQLITIDLASLK